ncbi:MAG: hypothetical protein R6V44_11095, partial [Paracoccaceae bacterium]
MRRLYALLGGLGSLALLAGLAALALWFGRDLLPPDRLVFAAGHAGGGYAGLAAGAGRVECVNYQGGSAVCA